jgi:hypothetical protein
MSIDSAGKKRGHSGLLPSPLRFLETGPHLPRRQGIRMGGRAAHPTGFLSAPLRPCARRRPFFFVLSFVAFVNFVVSRRQSRTGFPSPVHGQASTSRG